MTPRVTVTIDELVLDGVEAQPALEGSIRAELGRLVAEHGPPASGSRGDVHAGALGGGPLGREIARAVHGELRR